ncbi:MAG: hypothetical protein K1X89_25865, partial [Myxococcaceae bacterium]|nr:hypothetical protein [Myxococcaceae bacterium]
MAHEGDQVALQRARVLAQQGQVDAAAQAFDRAGAPEEAARVLASAGRLLEAGRLLAEAVRSPRFPGARAASLGAEAIALL